MKREVRFRNIKGVGQIRGPLPNKDSQGNLINLMGLFNFTSDTLIIKLGIQAPIGSIININNKQFEIGRTGILEYETGLSINFLAFETEITKDVIIDFVRN